jgi:8-oxo-dGTP pyrophosphatase MutT (NUDIX family)
MIQRSEYVNEPLKWGLPGGNVDGNETPESAARRETLEEIGMTIGDAPMVLIYTNTVHAPRFTFYTFACTVANEFEPKLNYESSDYCWCNLDSLPETLHWGMKQMLNHDNAAKLLQAFVQEQKKH